MRKICPFLFSIIFLFSVNIGHAQFITCIPDSLAGLGKSDQDFLDDLRKNPSYESITIVEVGDLFSMQVDGVLTFSVPGYNVIRARVNHVTVNNADSVRTSEYGQYSWCGDAFKIVKDSNNVDTADYFGAVCFYKSRGVVSGTIHPYMSNDVFELTTLGSTGKNVLIKYDVSYMSGLTGCSTDTMTTTGEPPSSSTSCNPVINVLVCYTTAAQASVPNITTTAVSGVSQLNTILVNSQMFGEIVFQVAGVEHVPDFFEVSTIGGTAYNAHHDPDLQLLRNEYEADIVVVLTDGNWSDAIGKVDTIGLVEPGAYAVIEADKVMFSYAFPHEVGHIMGARHQPTVLSIYGSDDSPGQGHGYSFAHGINLHGHIDIMSSATTGVSREPLWSSSDLMVHGHVFGIPTVCDARGLIQNNHCAVADFRTDEYIPFTTSISGPGHSNTGNNFNLTVTPYSGIPFYTYEWWLSVDGGNTFSYYTTSSENGPSTINFTMLAVPNMIFRVKATSNASETFEVFKTVANYSMVQTCCQDYMNNGFRTNGKPEEKKPVINAEKSIFNVYPNPCRDYMSIHTEIPLHGFTGNETIVITDLTGKKLYESTITNAVYDIDIKVDKFASGTYIVELANSMYSNIQKFTVIK